MVVRDSYLLIGVIIVITVTTLVMGRLVVVGSCLVLLIVVVAKLLVVITVHWLLFAGYPGRCDCQGSYIGYVTAQPCRGSDSSTVAVRGVCAERGCSRAWPSV